MITEIMTFMVMRHLDHLFYHYFYRYRLKSDDKSNGICNGPGDMLPKMYVYSNENSTSFRRGILKNVKEFQNSPSK